MKVFFSYGHDKNEYIVEMLKSDLEKNGHEVWVDKSKIRSGNDWRRAISEGILTSDMVMSFATGYALRKNGVCLDELSIAVAVKGAQIQSVLLEKGVDVPKNISYLQFVDMSDWNIYKDTDEFESWYKDKLKQILDVLNDPKTKIYEQEIQYLKEKFNPNLEISYRETQKDRIYCGREWLVDIISEWFNKPDKKRILALTGSPGSGKSTFISHEFIYNEKVAAVVYCKWDNSDSNNLDSITRSLIFQTASRYPDYRYALINQLRREETAGQKFADEGSTIFEKYFIKPLRNLIDGERPDLLILIDGIDEVERHNNIGMEGWRNELVSLIAKSSSSLPEWIYFLITSRNDNQVLLALENAERINLDDWQDQNRADISTYVDLCLGQKYSRKEKAKIKRKCDCNFQYAVLLCESLIKNVIDISEIDSVPDSLGRLYYMYFSRSFPDRNQYMDKYQPALSAICESADPIPSETLFRVLHWRRKEREEFRLKMSPYFQNSKEFKIFHRSLVDWLCSDESYEYGIDEETGWELIAGACYSAYVDDKAGMNDYELIHLLESMKKVRHPAYRELLKDEELANLLFTRAEVRYEEHRYSNALSMLEDIMKIMDVRSDDLSKNDMLFHTVLMTLKSYRAQGKNQEVLNTGEAFDAFVDAHGITVNEHNIDWFGEIWFMRGRAASSWENYWDKAIGLFEKAENELLKWNRNESAALVMNQCAMTLRVASRLDQALKQYEKIDRLFPDGSLKEKNPGLYIIVMTGRSFILQDFYRTDEAFAYLRECAEMEQANPDLISYANRSQIYYILGVTAYKVSSYEDALEYIDHSIELRKKAYGNNAVEICNDLNEKGHILLKMNRIEEAGSCFRESVRRRTGYYGTENVYTAFSMRNLAKYYMQCNDPEGWEEALDLLAQAAKAYEKHNQRVHPNVAMTLVDRADCLILLGRYEEALPCINEARDIYTVMDRPYGIANSWRAEGRLEEKKGRFAAAIECYQKAIAMFEKAGVKRDQHNIQELMSMIQRIQKSAE